VVPDTAVASSRTTARPAATSFHRSVAEPPEPRSDAAGAAFCVVVGVVVGVVVAVVVCPCAGLPRG
jgi:hypothetical protein